MEPQYNEVTKIIHVPKDSLYQGWTKVVAKDGKKASPVGQLYFIVWFTQNQIEAWKYCSTVHSKIKTEAKQFFLNNTKANPNNAC